MRRIGGPYLSQADAHLVGIGWRGNSRKVWGDLGAESHFWMRTIKAGEATAFHMTIIWTALPADGTGHNSQVPASGGGQYAKLSAPLSSNLPLRHPLRLDVCQKHGDRSHCHGEQKAVAEREAE